MHDKTLWWTALLTFFASIALAQPPGGDDCRTDIVQLATGVGAAGTAQAGTPLSPFSVDPTWKVIDDPQASTSEPRPATVIATLSAWRDPIGDSRWISSYGSSTQNTNGHYIFETCFCLRPSFAEPKLTLDLRADDRATVLLNQQQIGQTPQAYSFKSVEPTHIEVVDPSLFVAGRNCLQIDVENTNSVAMGLNASGRIEAQGAGLDRAECCQPTGSLQGLKWKDLDGDGIRGPGEPVLEGWTIQLSNGATATTDSNGNYYFVDLPPGSYGISEIMQPGWVQTYPPGGSHQVDLALGQALDGLSFGNRQEEICPAPGDPGVVYLVQGEPIEEICSRVCCADDERFVQDACGCRCEEDPPKPPDLELEKSWVGAGSKDQSSFEIVVANVGEGSTTGPVTVREEVPAGSTLVSIQGEGWTCTRDFVCTWNGPAVQPGQSLPPIVVVVEVPREGAENCASVSTEGEGNDANNRDCVTVPECPNPDDPDVIYQAEDPEICATIRFQCPPEAQYFGGRCGCGCLRVCPAGFAAISTSFSYAGDCSTAQEMAFEDFSRPEYLEACAAAGGPETEEVAGVRLNGCYESHIAGEIANADVAVCCPRKEEPPELEIEKSFSAGPEGLQLVFAITVTNVGSRPAPGPIEVTDAVQPGLDVIGADGAVCSAGQEVVCQLPQGLAPGESKTLHITVHPNRGGFTTFANCALLTAGGEGESCVEVPCPPKDDPSVEYIEHSESDPRLCQTVLDRGGCPAGQTFFWGTCGCGCRKKPDCVWKPPRWPDFGWSLASRTDAAGRPTVLVLAGSAGEEPIDEVRLGLGRRAARQAEPLWLPPGWSSTVDGDSWVARGPAVQPPIHLKLGLERRPKKADLEMWSEGRRVEQQEKVELAGLPPVETTTELDGLLRLPRKVSPGETVGLRPMDPLRTPPEGEWRIGGKVLPARRWPIDCWDRPPYDWPVPAEPFRGLDVTYHDPWGDPIVEAEPEIEVDPEAPDGQTEENPRIESGTRFAVAGAEACVCGRFPSERSQAGLLFDSGALGPPLSGSRRTIYFQIPADAPIGKHQVSGIHDAGFGTDTWDLEVIAIRAAIDQENLFSGGQTDLHLTVVGTERPVSLEITNRTPGIVSLEGGEQQTITTSGGEQNQASRNVRANTRGNFDIRWRLLEDTCPCD